jgi:hypothetical protein
VLKRSFFRPRVLIFIAIAVTLALLALGEKEILRAISTRLAF